jgi:molecular chaperone DnaK (HSP70)
MLNEPTAAAIAYGLVSQASSTTDSSTSGSDAGTKRILIYDFGGGTLDVTILTVDGPVLEVMSTSGDTHLGGQDVDNELMQYCIMQFKEKKGA